MAHFEVRRNQKIPGLDPEKNSEKTNGFKVSSRLEDNLSKRTKKGRDKLANNFIKKLKQSGLEVSEKGFEAIKLAYLAIQKGLAE